MQNERIQNLETIWRALGECGDNCGWRLLALEEFPAGKVFGGRYFPGNMESVIFVFPRLELVQRQSFPQGNGFEVIPLVEPSLFSGVGVALCRKPEGSADLFLKTVEDVLELLASQTSADNAGKNSRLFGTNLEECKKGVVSNKVEPSLDNVLLLAETIKESFTSLVQIRIFVLTNGQVKTRQFKPKEIDGVSVSLEVMDIDRLYRHTCSGQPLDEIIVDFKEYCGASLPCVYVAEPDCDYDCILCSIPGEALYKIYERYGDRLLEANVRSFLNANGKVNKGIRETLRNNPLRFMAYNNGIVLTGEAIQREKTDQGYCIGGITGMQLVNGGQTVASLFFTKKKFPTTDLSKVRVSAKILYLRNVGSDENSEEFVETFISDVSRCSNSQNAVRTADLSSNKPFHVEMEKLAETIYCSDGGTRWFYERSNGKYNVMVARNGTTDARLKKIKQERPRDRKITKTDLAKYLYSWAQKPDKVSLGAQKNFEQFMAEIEERERTGEPIVFDSLYFKNAVAMAILFKNAHSALNKQVPAYLANVVTYLIAMVSRQYGSRISLEQIWKQQELSLSFKNQLRIWGKFVYQRLIQTSEGKMPTEWAKKSERWIAMREFTLPEPEQAIQEIKDNTAGSRKRI